MTYWDIETWEEKEGPNAPEGESVLVFEAHEGEIALVFSSDPDTIHLGNIGATGGLISVELNATADPNEDEQLEEAKGSPVDIQLSLIHI